MSKYESMSDFEINKLVAEAQGLTFYCEVARSQSIIVVGNGGPIDYCNSWADMGPLLVDNQISLTFVELMPYGSWMANFKMLSCVHANPLRAAAIIYLESLEQNNA